MPFSRHSGDQKAKAFALVMEYVIENPNEEEIIAALQESREAVSEVFRKHNLELPEMGYVVALLCDAFFEALLKTAEDAKRDGLIDGLENAIGEELGNV